MRTRAIPGCIRFLPLLAVYVPLVWFLQPGGLIWDEGRYAALACNLARGYFSPPGEVDLWYGPGYPLALLPAAALQALPFAGRLLNAFLALGAVMLLYGVLREYVSGRVATVLAYVMGLHPQLLEHIPLLMSETLAVFLACAALYVYIRLSRQETPRAWQYGLAALALAALALTKVLYGYVMFCGFLLAALVFLACRARTAARAAAVTAFALALCMPYLMYTYRLTGKLFYWGSSGGLSLYWMSSPYDGDLGEWHSREAVACTPGLAADHESFFQTLDALPAQARDEALRRKAVRNILNHPTRYARNLLANAGRLLFNYPFPYNPQNLSKLLHIVPGAYLLAAMTVAFYLTVAGWSRVPGEIRAVLGFGSIAFGGSCLLSAYNRMLLPLLPIALLWLGYMFHRWQREEST